MSSSTKRLNLLISCLLGLAAVALVGSLTQGNAGKISLGVATAAIVAAFGLTSWRVGRDSSAPVVPDMRPLLDRLDRIALALESRPLTATTEKLADLTTVTLAIAERRWQAAETLLSQHADHPDAERLAGELSSAKQLMVRELLAELKAAQEVNDPDRVLEICSGLATVMTTEELAEVEARTVKWSLALIMKRLRTGTVRPDVSELAAKVADRFPRSVEGASLRASLPTLRRSAGLCPRCARPYRGIADACPLCLAPVPAPDLLSETNGTASKTVPEADVAPLGDLEGV